ncbi:MAG: hypothetical protein EPO30_11825 [Lysobacteraceae bacterium]|nr:MAG: hypothetical protein EPO30_11825 [Xanthomonadaceae bacterium]
MPPAVVPLLLVAIGVPAAFRAAVGRPRGLATAWLAAIAAVAAAQVFGELTASRTGVLGDAQLLYAVVAAAISSGVLALVERAAR